MNHKQKVKLARKMQSKEEIKSGSPIFSSKNWNARKNAKSLKVLKQQQKHAKKNK